LLLAAHGQVADHTACQAFLTRGIAKGDTNTTNTNTRRAGFAALTLFVYILRRLVALLHAAESQLRLPSHVGWCAFFNITITYMTP
jgi:hypothetical protein